MSLKKLILMVDSSAFKSDACVGINPVDWANIVALCSVPKAEISNTPNILLSDAKVQLTKAKKIHTCQICGEFITEESVYKNYKVKTKSGFWHIFKSHDACGLKIKGFQWDGRNAKVVL